MATPIGRLLRITLLAGLLALDAGAGLAATVRGAYEIAGKLVPLPPGQWTVVGETVEDDGSEPFVTRALARVEAGAVAGIAIVRANAVGRNAPLTAPRECSRDDIHLAYIAYDTEVDGLCLFINHVVLSDAVAGPPVWLAARERLGAMGAVVTDTWLEVGIRARNRNHVVDVRYYFAPPDFRTSLPTASWAGNRWSPERTFDDADRRAAIRRLGTWAIWVREAVELGLRGQIPDEALPPALWEGPDLGPRLTARHLAGLDALKAAGRIGEAEYRRQRRIVEMVGIDPERSEMPLWQRSIWKRVSHGVVSAAESLGVSYLVIGGFWPSVGFAAIFETARPIGAYFHDLAWPGAANAAATPMAPRDFAEIGRID